MSRKCETHLIPDIPTDIDDFHSMDRIAEGIAELIRNEPGGKAIALEGTWGSGKSSVVKLLRKNLAENDNIMVFTYDAWAHSADPLRRSFLEKLVAALVRKHWTEEKAWEKDLRKLRSAHEDSKSTSEPRLKRAGIAVAVATLLVPVGYTLLAALWDKWRSSFCFAQNLSTPWFLVGAPLVLLPFIAAGLFYLAARWSYACKRRRHPHRNIERPRFASVFVTSGHSEVSSETYRSPNPTSIEFSDVFNRLMMDVLASDKKDKKLLLVMDNLDRLDRKEALNAWATMRSFVETSEAGQTEEERPWLRRFWLLVPFDPGTPAKLWGDDPAQHETNGGKGNSAGRRNNTAGDPNREVGCEFIEKTFQVKLCVPPPVLSDWGTFMVGCLKKALPRHTDDEFDTVFRLYRTMALTDSRSPTPREVKLFVNKLAAVHLQWDDEIALPIQAAYVLMQARGDISSRSIADPKLLKSNVRNLLGDEDWQSKLAALVYNVPPDKARQVWLRPKIERALHEGNGSELAERLKVDGASEVCYDVIRDELGGWVEKEQANVALAGAALDGAEDVRDRAIDSAWGMLADSLGELEGTSWLNERTARGAVAIMKHAADTSSSIIRFLELLSRTAPATKANAEPAVGLEEQEPVDDWTKGALAIVSHLSKSGSGTLLTQYFRVPGPPEFYMGVVDALIRTDAARELVNYFRIGLSADPLEKHLETSCANGLLNDKWRLRVRRAIELQPGADWTPLAEKAATRLKAESLSIDESSGCLQAVMDIFYLKARGGERNLNVLDALAKTGRFFFHLSRATKADSGVNQATCILLILETDPDATGQSNRQDVTEGKQRYRKILGTPHDYEKVLKPLRGRVEYYMHYDRLLEIATGRRSVRALMHALLDGSVKAGHVASLPSPEGLVDRLELLEDDLLQSVLAVLIKKEDFAPRLVKKGYSREAVRLYVSVLKVASTTQSGVLAPLLTGGLGGLDKTTWDEVLMKGGPELELALEVQKGGHSVELEVGFYDALLAYARKLRGGKTEPSSLMRANSNHVPALMSQTQQNEFWPAIRDMLLAAPDESVVPVTDLWGERLVESGVLGKKADDLTRMLVQAVGRHDAKELQWAVHALEHDKLILKEASRHARENLRDHAEAAIKTAPPTKEVHMLLEHLAELLGSGGSSKSRSGS